MRETTGTQNTAQETPEREAKSRHTHIYCIVSKEPLPLTFQLWDTQSQKQTGREPAFSERQREATIKPARLSELWPVDESTPPPRRVLSVAAATDAASSTRGRAAATTVRVSRVSHVADQIEPHGPPGSAGSPSRCIGPPNAPARPGPPPKHGIVHLFCGTDRCGNVVDDVVGERPRSPTGNCEAAFAARVARRWITDRAAFSEQQSRSARNDARLESNGPYTATTLELPRQQHHARSLGCRSRVL